MPTLTVLAAAPRRSTALPPLSQPTARLVVVDEVHDLADHVAAWEALAAAALEPNVFFEPWLLLPAVYAFGAAARLRFVLVYATLPDGSETLAGFVPIERRRTYRRLPLRRDRLWLHKHCYLGTPLLHAKYARLAWAAMLDWLTGDAALLELPVVPATGPFAQLLAELAPSPPFVTDRHERGLLRPGADADAYLHATLSGSTRRALKRRHKRLAETGRLTVEAVADRAGLRGWLEEFLGMEASGWKGRRGTALASRGPDTIFFRMAALAAAASDRLLRLTLRLDGRPLAARCAFRAGAGAFSFKSAYDEAFAAHSPGVLLELENIRHCHALAGLGWMDSCTSADNEIINRLWHDRRVLQTVTLATTGRPGDLTIRLLRWLQAQRHPNRLPKSSETSEVAAFRLPKSSETSEV